MKQLPPKVRDQFLKLIHARPQADADMDDLNSFFLQVVFALLLIFMCAFFLFITKVGGEITQIDRMKKQIEEAEEAKILRAAEQIAEEYRIRYGLKEFLHIDPFSGAKSYEFKDVISGGKFQKNTLAGKSFAQGAATAFADYRDPAALTVRWETRVLEIAGDTAQNHPKVVHEMVAANIEKLRIEVIEVQTLAVASIQQYLAAHPELVRDRIIRALILEINLDKNPADRERLFGELTRQLETYVYRNLQEMCGCEMLRELK